jgi:hypothetical protein
MPSLGQSTSISPSPHTNFAPSLNTGQESGTPIAGTLRTIAPRSLQEIQTDLATVGADLEQKFTELGAQKQRNTHVPAQTELPGSSITDIQSTRKIDRAVVKYIDARTGVRKTWQLLAKSEADKQKLRIAVTQAARYAALEQELSTARNTESKKRKLASEAGESVSLAQKRPKWAHDYSSTRKSATESPKEEFDDRTEQRSSPSPLPVEHTELLDQQQYAEMPDQLANTGTHASSSRVPITQQNRAESPQSELLSVTELRSVLDDIATKMRSGNLTIVGNATRVTGIKVVYTPNESMYIMGTDYDDILPDQESLNMDPFESYCEDFGNRRTRDIAPVLPVQAVLTLGENRLKISDGHHRFAAALAENVPIEIEVCNQREAMSFRNWSGVELIDEV